MVHQLLVELASFAGRMINFIFKVAIAAVVLLGVPAVVLSVFDWILRFWGWR
jgi:hypothetical protein